MIATTRTVSEGVRLSRESFSTDPLRCLPLAGSVVTPLFLVPESCEVNTGDPDIWVASLSVVNSTSTFSVPLSLLSCKVQEEICDV